MHFILKTTGSKSYLTNIASVMLKNNVCYYILVSHIFRGEISLRKLPKLVRHVVEICGFQFNQEKDQKVTN